MKIALTIWQGRISPVFESAQEVYIFEIQEGKVYKQNEKKFLQSDPYFRVSEIQDWAIDVLVCGAISRDISSAIEASGIHLLSFVSASLEEAIDAYLRGCLYRKKYNMPGCHRRMRRHGRGGFCRKRGRN